MVHYFIVQWGAHEAISPTAACSHQHHPNNIDHALVLLQPIPVPICPHVFKRLRAICALLASQPAIKTEWSFMEISKNKIRVRSQFQRVDLAILEAGCLQQIVEIAPAFKVGDAVTPWWPIIRKLQEEASPRTKGRSHILQGNGGIR